VQALEGLVLRSTSPYSRAASRSQVQVSPKALIWARACVPSFWRRGRWVGVGVERRVEVDQVDRSVIDVAFADVEVVAVMQRIRRFAHSFVILAVQARR
jgi:hypothetical protein